jgi:hypothetical protein
MLVNVDDIFAAGQHYARRLQSPGELVWTIIRSGARLECELHFEVAAGTWLAMVYRSGWPISGQRFILREEAMQWAEGESRAMEAGQGP